jgi:hypothetical protein
LVAALLLLGCNGGGGGGGTPTDPNPAITLALTATPTSITLGGQSQIVAQVQATGGASRAGLRVVLATNLGQLDDLQLTTDANGRAATTLRAGSAGGVARVTGTADGRATAATDVRMGLDRTLTLEVAPSTITGSEVATVNAFAFEGTGVPVPAGTLVTLSTDRGQLGATTVATSPQGTASTTLRAAGAAGTAHLNASLPGGPTATAAATLVAAPPSGTTLRLTVNPPTAPASGTTGVTILVAAADGSPVLGAEVTLTSTIGTLDNARLHTDSSGLATTTLRGDGRRGTATVVATLAGTTTNARLTVRFT